LEIPGGTNHAYIFSLQKNIDILNMDEKVVTTPKIMLNQKTKWLPEASGSHLKHSCETFVWKEPQCFVLLAS